MVEILEKSEYVSMGCKKWNNRKTAALGGESNQKSAKNDDDIGIKKKTTRTYCHKDGARGLV